jgi:hypothetical protein
MQLNYLIQNYESENSKTKEEQKVTQNLIEMTIKMQLWRTICYSVVP